MGFKQVRTSDISGEDLAENEVVTVNVKTAGKVFDCKADEIKGLKRLTGVVALEIKLPNGEIEQVLTTEKDFHAVVPQEVVDNADSNRGRRSGFRPANGS